MEELQQTRNFAACPGALAEWAGRGCGRGGVAAVGGVSADVGNDECFAGTGSEACDGYRALEGVAGL